MHVSYKIREASHRAVRQRLQPARTALAVSLELVDDAIADVIAGRYRETPTVDAAHLAVSIRQPWSATVAEQTGIMSQFFTGRTEDEYLRFHQGVASPSTISDMVTAAIAGVLDE